MDRQSIALLIPIFALLIPVAAIIGGFLVKLQKGRLEEARLRAGDPGVLAEVDELRSELHQVRGELAEVAERLDFAERLLTAKAGEPKGNP